MAWRARTSAAADLLVLRAQARAAARSAGARAALLLASSSAARAPIASELASPRPSLVDKTSRRAVSRSASRRRISASWSGVARNGSNPDLRYKRATAASVRPSYLPVAGGFCKPIRIKARCSWRTSAPSSPGPRSRKAGTDPTNTRTGRPDWTITTSPSCSSVPALPMWDTTPGAGLSADCVSESCCGNPKRAVPRATTVVARARCSTGTRMVDAGGAFVRAASSAGDRIVALATQPARGRGEHGCHEDRGHGAPLHGPSVLGAR